MDYNNSDAEGSINFTIEEIANGPVLAAFLSIEIVMAILVNSFIVIYTLLHPEPLKKQSSIVLLFGLAATNLLLGPTVLVFPAVTAGAGQWVFGETIAQKEAVCKFNGYLNMSTLLIRYDMLSLVSVDRFVFIVKPMIHKQYFKSKTTAVVMVTSWLMLAIISTIPFYTTGFFFQEPSYVCHARVNTVLLIVLLVVIVLVIGITSIWTFLFTRKFLKKHYDKVKQNEEQDHVYNKRVCKLFGLFSLMITTQVIALAIAMCKNIVDTIVGETSIELAQCVIILGSSLSIICTPAIQCYFRKDMWAAICRGVTAVRKALSCRICRKNINSNKAEAHDIPK